MPEPNFDNRTLYHGDNLKFLQALDSESVDLIPTDPPFNKGRDFHATPDSLAAGGKFEDRWRWNEDILGEGESEDGKPLTSHRDWIEAIREDYPAVWEVIDAANAVHRKPLTRKEKDRARTAGRLSDDGKVELDEQGNPKYQGSGMGAFLCYMGVRLMEMKRVLKPTGSIYLHCDPTASHYLKAMMDAIFGWQNFRNEIVWKRTNSHKEARQFGRSHDVILFYTKSSGYTWETQYLPLEKSDEQYRYTDELGNFQPIALTAPGVSAGESGTPWRGIDPAESGRHWATPIKGSTGEFITERNLIPGWPDAYPTVHERLDALDAAGLIYWPERGSMPRLKRYLESTKGAAADSVIVDIGKIEATSSESYGYATQKPLALYERIIAASSNPGDIVLDPFCGCATTPIAAERLERQWIGMDIWDGAHTAVIVRLVASGILDIHSVENDILANVCDAVREGDMKAGKLPQDIRAEIAARHADGKLANVPKPLQRPVPYATERPDLSLTQRAVTCTTEPPERTDDGEIAAPALEPPPRYAKEAWEKLSRAEMVEILAEAQMDSRTGKVVCAGCGDQMRWWNMQLDHISPKSDGGVNTIDNRVLLCQSCNGVKGNTLAMEGLRRAIRKMEREESAEDAMSAFERARRKAEYIRRTMR